MIGVLWDNIGDERRKIKEGEVRRDASALRSIYKRKEKHVKREKGSEDIGCRMKTKLPL